MDANEIYDKYEYLVEQTIYRHYKNPEYVAKSHLMQKEDLFQIGRYGLWKACLSYEQYQYRFRSYAINTIKGYITNALQRQGTLLCFKTTDKYDVKDSVKLIDYNGIVPNHMQLRNSEIIPTDERLEDELIGNLTYEQLTSNLNERDKVLVRKKIFEYQNQEVANELGISRQLATHYYKKAIEKVRMNYEEMMGEVV